MTLGQASRTAEFMALFRALESVRGPERRLFEDRLAPHFIRPSLRFVVRAARVRCVNSLVAWFIDARWPGARSSGVVRTRYIDDQLRAALRDGIEQVVILGAGFDCRPYRIAGLEHTRVFEVDHPDTSSLKRRQLQNVLSSQPDHVRFVSMDFNRQPLADAMAAAGYTPAGRTFILWEGVTNYLAEPAVDATLRWCATAAPESHVIFTYVDQRVLEHPQDFHGTTRLFQALAKSGEPWTFGMHLSEVTAYLAVRGLDLVDDLGAAEYRSLYWNQKQFRGYEFYRIVSARVRAPAHAP